MKPILKNTILQRFLRNLASAGPDANAVIIIGGNLKMLPTVVMKSKILLISGALADIHLLGKEQELEERVKRLHTVMLGKASRNLLQLLEYHAKQ